MERRCRLRRSVLVTPGSRVRAHAKAAASPADVVLFDLEDAVAPAEKETARSAVVETLRNLDWGTKSVGVRVNGVDTGWCHDDLITVATAVGRRLDLVVVPKVTGERDIWFVDTLLGQLEDKLGLPPNGIAIEALIEETGGLSCIEGIAACSPRLEALTLGFADLAASQGVRMELAPVEEAAAWARELWQYARTRVVVAARACGLDAVDGASPNYTDLDALGREARWAAAMGMAGKWAIHPAQLDVLNVWFSPSEAEVEQARRVIVALEAAQAVGEGAAALDGLLIDAATARAAEAVLERVADIAGAHSG